LCEAFYYLGQRWLDVVCNHLGWRVKAPNVVMVRNDLLFHPQVTNPNFAFGTDLPYGPQIKPLGHRDCRPRIKRGGRAESQAEAAARLRDKGLYYSASEVLAAIDVKLGNGGSRA
jgi:hypothetical protein